MRMLHTANVTPWWTKAESGSLYRREGIFAACRACKRGGLSSSFLSRSSFQQRHGILCIKKENQTASNQVLFGAEKGYK